MSTTSKSSTNFNSSNYRDRAKNEGVASSSNAAHSNEGKTLQKKPKYPPKRTREVKCSKCLGMGHYAYECPTKKIALLKDNREYIVGISKLEATNSSVLLNYYQVISLTFLNFFL